MIPSRIFLVALGALAACAGPRASYAGDPELLAAFVVFGQSDSGAPTALARVLVEGADTTCPALVSADGTEHPTVARRNPDPEHFPVRACEALYPLDGTSLRIAGTSEQLPGVPATVSRITVFGDTGCKPKHQHGCHPDSSHHWPFHEMADAAFNADPGPDLVLHMGDYNYRGTPGHIQVNDKREPVYDAGDNTPHLSCKLKGPYFGQNSLGSDSPDNWKDWRADFFDPAAELLRAAPWVFARGNHELCSRAGPGWFYLLDPGSDLLGGSQGQLDCPAAEGSDPLVFREPYRVDLGGLSVVVLDSANACDQGSLHQGHFDAQFERIQSLVEAAPGSNAVWLQSHRPLWGVKKPEKDAAETHSDASGKYAFIDHTLQTAYARHPLPRPLHLTLSGHMHRFQAISFEPKGEVRGPTQLIIGNGGVALAHNYPEHGFPGTIDKMPARGFGLSTFGYMEIQLEDSGDWEGRLLDRKGHELANCDSRQESPTGACAPTDG